MKKLFYFSLLLVVVALMGSCKKSKEQQRSNLTAFEQTLTKSDSIEVQNLVDKYFKLVIDGKFYDAASMLYNPSKDSKNGEPQPLENAQLQKVVGLLQSIPVVDYRIEYMKFDEEVHNEVLCEVVMVRASEVSQELTTKFAFCPIRYMGYWVLCVDDFEAGTTGVKKNALRDSLRRVYEEKKQDSLAHK